MRGKLFRYFYFCASGTFTRASRKSSFSLLLEGALPPAIWEVTGSRTAFFFLCWEVSHDARISIGFNYLFNGRLKISAAQSSYICTAEFHPQVKQKFTLELQIHWGICLSLSAHSPQVDCAGLLSEIILYFTAFGISFVAGNSKL